MTICWSSPVHAFSVVHIHTAAIWSNAGHSILRFQLTNGSGCIANLRSQRPVTIYYCYTSPFLILFHFLLLSYLCHISFTVTSVKFIPTSVLSRGNDSIFHSKSFVVLPTTIVTPTYIRIHCALHFILSKACLFLAFYLRRSVLIASSNPLFDFFSSYITTYGVRASVLHYYYSFYFQSHKYTSRTSFFHSTMYWLPSNVQQLSVIHNVVWPLTFVI